MVELLAMQQRFQAALKKDSKMVNSFSVYNHLVSTSYSRWKGIIDGGETHWLKKMPSEDAKAVKKEEAEEGNMSLSSLVRKKITNANNAASRKLKKEENDDNDDDKPIRASLSGSRAKAVKEEIDEDDEKKPISKRYSSVGVSKVKKETQKEEPKKKREKKVYDLPGQKRDQPEEREPLRIFYGSLYKQIPTSEMAQIWLMESGLLPAEKAKKVLEMKLQKGGKFSSPAKSAASTPRSNSKSVTEKKQTKKSSSEALSGKKKGNDSKPTAKKRKKDSDDDDDDEYVLASRTSKKLRAK